MTSDKITTEMRQYIEKTLKENSFITNKKLAQILNIGVTSVGHELEKGGGRENYTEKKATEQTEMRRKNRGRNRRGVYFSEKESITQRIDTLEEQVKIIMELIEEGYGRQKD